MLILCTKNVHFPFGGKTFVQPDGVAMGPPLGPVLADLFMVELFYGSSSLNWIHEIVEKMCGWNHLFCKNGICRVYSFNCKQFSCEHSVHVRNGEKMSFTILRCFIYKKRK